MRPDGLRCKVWLIDLQCTGVPRDLELLRASFGDLLGGWRPEVVALSDGGLGATYEAVVAALNEIRAYDGLRIVWIGGHTAPNGMGNPALRTDDFEAAHRTRLSMVELWHALAQAAEHNPLVALVDVCQAAADPKLQTIPPMLAAFAACRADQKASTSPAGGWFSQRVCEALAAGWRTPSLLVEGLTAAVARSHHGAQTPWMAVGAAVSGVWLGPNLTPVNGERLEAGHVLGYRYRLNDPIGRGAFSVVWHADDLHRGDVVALKVLHSDWVRSEDRVRRFFRGAREMARFSHPNIVSVREARGDSGGHLYFSMTLIKGCDLQIAVERGQVGPADAVRIALQIGDALLYAHRQRTIHRDVKPGNILIDEAGQAHLTDFDLVRAEDTKNSSQHTVGLGTFIYAPPEMLKAGKSATNKSDVFGLAMSTVFVLHGHGLDDDAYFDIGRLSPS